MTCTSAPFPDPQLKKGLVTVNGKITQKPKIKMNLRSQKYIPIAESCKNPPKTNQNTTQLAKKKQLSLQSKKFVKFEYSSSIPTNSN
jgi:hypothetical protein